MEKKLDYVLFNLPKGSVEYGYGSTVGTIRLAQGANALWAVTLVVTTGHWPVVRGHYSIVRWPPALLSTTICWYNHLAGPNCVRLAVVT